MLPLGALSVDIELSIGLSRGRGARPARTSPRSASGDHRHGPRGTERSNECSGRDVANGAGHDPRDGCGGPPRRDPLSPARCPLPVVCTVPKKSSAYVKERHAVEPGQRHALAVATTRDTVAALEDSDAVHEVVVLYDDPTDARNLPGVQALATTAALNTQEVSSVRADVDDPASLAHALLLGCERTTPPGARRQACCWTSCPELHRVDGGGLCPGHLGSRVGDSARPDSRDLGVFGRCGRELYGPRPGR